MSWQATGWAAQQTAGGSGPKLTLMLLASHAWPNGITYVGRATLAEVSECRPATVTANLARLEDAGLIWRGQRRRANGSRSTDWIVLAPSSPDRGAMPDADGDDLPEAVAEHARQVQGADSVPSIDGVGQVRFSGGPEPSLTDNGSACGASVHPEQNAETAESQSSIEPTTSESSGSTAAAGRARTREARAREAAQQLPDGFPPELRPHARAVFRVLRGVAEQHNAREVTPRGVGLAIMGAPGRRYVALAYELGSWAAAPPRPIRDVVATYRTWLSKEPRHAGVESLDAAGAPGGADPPPGVTSLHGRRGRPQPGDYIEAGRRAAARERERS